jgi:hypothetical protein
MASFPLRRSVLAAAAAAALLQAPPLAAQQLRLAKSLCASMTGQVLASQMLPPLSSGAQAQGNTNAALSGNLEQQREAYFARLDAIKPFNGLYATGQADHALGDGTLGGRYSVGLEWELYDQGRGESRKQLDRLRNDNKAQYLQLMRDTEARQLQESLLAIDQMRNRLLAALYKREADAIQPVLLRRKQQLAAGRITKAEFAEIEYKAERAALRGRHYAATADVVLLPQAQELANHIESLVLRPEGDLAELAASRSPELQLQELLAQRTRLLPSVKDKLSVRLYAERARDFERGPYNTAGVRVRVPLDADKGLSEAAEASRALYDGQQESIRIALRQKLALLADRLRLKQNDMRVLLAENRMVRTQAESACYRLDYPVASLPGDADHDVEELTLRLYELQREILSARLDLLEALTQISALVKPKQAQELYSLSPSP